MPTCVHAHGASRCRRLYTYLSTGRPVFVMNLITDPHFLFDDDVGCRLSSGDLSDNLSVDPPIAISKIKPFAVPNDWAEV